MNLLKSIGAIASAQAAAAVHAALAEGAHLGTELIDDAKEVGAKILADLVEEAGKVEHQVEDSFLALTKAWGGQASTFVTQLLPTTVMDGVTLDGNAKANLAATQLTAAAADAGITIAEQDVTTLIKNAFLGVKDFVGQLSSGAQKALAGL